MTLKLFIQAFTKFLLGLLLVGLMLFYVPIIVKRIRNEEQVLERELNGYAEYKQRVRYRLIPFIW